MASAAELWPPEPGDVSRNLRRDDRLPMLSAVGGQAGGAPGGDGPEVEGERGDEALDDGVSVAEDVLWVSMEPERGQMVRARYSDHHTASLVWTRDDREGHWEGPGQEQQNWWSHDMGKWMSWPEIGRFLSGRAETFIVEILVRPGRSITHRGCPPDGSCDIPGASCDGC